MHLIYGLTRTRMHNFPLRSIHMFKYSFDLHQLKFAVSGEFLSERSWKGLEEKLGQTAVTKAVEGSKGIAASYNTEPPT